MLRIENSTQDGVHFHNRVHLLAVSGDPYPGEHPTHVFSPRENIYLLVSSHRTECARLSRKVAPEAEPTLANLSTSRASHHQIPTMGMLAYFVHGYASSNMLTPDYILILFIVSVLALAWAIFTLFSYHRSSANASFVAIIDLGTRADTCVPFSLSAMHTLAFHFPKAQPHGAKSPS